MSNTPADIINQALDAIGSEVSIGDPEEGTREAQVSLRAYMQCLRQLQRAAHWDFCRKQAPLLLLADATGNTANVGNLVPAPWAYEYAYPGDCLKARFVPLNRAFYAGDIPAGNISLPTTAPTFPQGVCPIVGARPAPAPFLVATDFNYPTNPAVGGGQWWNQPGISPTGRTVILTNVPHAHLVYTAEQAYPSLWDPQFRAAMVAYLAAEIALPLTKDKKFGLQVRATNLAIAKERVIQARITDGNEGWSTVNREASWMRARNAGTGSSGYGGWRGCENVMGWDMLSFEGGAF